MTKSHEWEIYSNYKINLKKGEFKKRWKEQKLEQNKTTTVVEKFINIQFKSTTAFNSNTQTGCSEVRTKTTAGQYSLVRVEQVRLVRSLLCDIQPKIFYLNCWLLR